MTPQPTPTPAKPEDRCPTCRSTAPAECWRVNDPNGWEPHPHGGEPTPCCPDSFHQPEATPERVAECPTCGSNDPKWVRGFTKTCPDPFHTPSPPDTEARAEQTTAPEQESAYPSPGLEGRATASWEPKPAASAPLAPTPDTSTEQVVPARLASDGSRKVHREQWPASPEPISGEQGITPEALNWYAEHAEQDQLADLHPAEVEPLLRGAASALASERAAREKAERERGTLDQFIAAIREAMEQTKYMDDEHRYHMLCVKLLSRISAFSPPALAAWDDAVKEQSDD